MASAWFKPGKKHFAQGEVVWKASGGDTIKATLIDTVEYTFSSSHEYMNLDTVAAAAKVSTVALTLLTPTDGALDADDSTFSLVTGEQCAVIIVWKDGGGGGTSQSGTTDYLLFYLDTAVGLPVTPNGEDVKILWDNGPNKIAVL